ncbi:MAG: aminotransferase class III-fold pyridoxal phosphate-dependent enzyme [Candidatus Aenigmarchaeota archaeon]|nr:aminotransferase class III-fold pyridoxal phosphate-dependent enzyme [Candidatus Aenigmarchaeota archaeon]
MSKSDKIIKRDMRILSTSMTRDYPYAFKKGRGCYIWDEDNKKYLDFAASIATMNVGYTNPDVVKAIKKQAEKGTHCAFPDFYAELPVRFAETVLGNMPKPLNKGRVFFSNSGTESVEAALKLAKWAKRGKYVIAFDHSFHGRTMGALSMTFSKPVQRAGFAPFLPVKHVPYPYWYRMKMEPEECSQFCLRELEKTMKLLDGECSALFIEPIQGEGGYVVPPKSFMKGARKLCDDYDILMCDDEVQAGCWRTGKFLGIENFSVTPDIVSLAKALGGGLPLGLMIAKPGLMKWPKSAHSNTFGGNLLSCAAGLATLNYIKKKKLGQNAVRVGNYIMKRLNEMKEKYECLGDVRGLGLMIGMEIVQNKKSRKPGKAEREFIMYKSYENRLIMLGAGTSVIRICPALNITRAQADAGLNVLDKVFHMLHHKK